MSPFLETATNQITMAELMGAEAKGESKKTQKIFKKNIELNNTHICRTFIASLNIFTTKYEASRY